MYKVLLQSRGNPDFGQNPDEELSPEVLATAETLQQASRLCQGYVATYDLGGGNWSGGAVYDKSGEVVARVSYNGRVWPPQQWHPGMQPLI